jgi:hypothetical protein
VQTPESAVASASQRDSTIVDDYCPKCGEAGMEVGCGDPDCGLGWDDEDEDPLVEAVQKVINRMESNGMGNWPEAKALRQALEAKA